MLRIVLADDEKKVILLLQKLIDWQALGYQVVGVANDGLRALELVRQEQPHLLLTDIRMPGCDGIELIRQAKALQPALHCIVISGYREFAYAQSAIKYGVEDYVLKPLKQAELCGILLRLKDKIGQEHALEYQLRKSGERRQESALAALKAAADRQQPFLTAAQAEAEYGFRFAQGSYFAVLVKPDIPNAEQYPDGYQLLMQHALEIVRRQVRQIADAYAVAIQREGVAALLYIRAYQAAEGKRCFTKIRKEIEKQREVFGNIRCTVCLGSRRDCPEQLSDSMREALWLCRDRLCRVQPWRDVESEQPAFSERYQMDAAQKKRFREAVEFLDETGFEANLQDSYRCVLSSAPVSGQMLEDWFHQVLEACLYGLQQNGSVEEWFAQTMEENLWRCTNAQDVFRLLQRDIRQQLQRVSAEKSQREIRPITEAKRYIRQHYQQTLRLEDVSSAAGFNATYFSALFKKETGQNFMDYLTELRISKAKELLCGDTLSVQDVAELVGYQDLKYFSRLFKKTTGVSPSSYKKLYQ